MKAKSIAALIVIIVLIALLGFVIINGFSAGIYDVKPLSGIQQGLDITGGVYVVYQADEEITDPDELEQGLQGAMTVLRTRLDAKGLTEATITKQGSDSIRVEIPINDTSEIQDANAISQYIGTPARLTFVTVDGDVVLEGSDIVSAEPMVTEGNEYHVAFELSEEGTSKFAEATKANVGQVIYIKIDDEIISAPTVDEPITGGEGIITGDFTQESVINLASQIESGALPIDLNEVEVRTMSATLGEDALENSIFAGMIGFIILFVFMAIMYRVPGLASIIALVLYVELVMLLIASVPGVQLTLPGIAGIVLGIGMAVDANVIMFERFKEEVRSGKTLRVAHQYSFKKAFITILDSNITTLICAIVLAIFGMGTIKSFAYTLIISIGVSMFTSLVVTRGLMKLMINAKKDQTKVGAFVKMLPESKGGAEE